MKHYVNDVISDFGYCCCCCCCRFNAPIKRRGNHPSPLPTAVRLPSPARLPQLPPYPSVWLVWQIVMASHKCLLYSPTKNLSTFYIAPLNLCIFNRVLCVWLFTVNFFPFPYLIAWWLSRQETKIGSFFLRYRFPFVLCGIHLKINLSAYNFFAKKTLIWISGTANRISINCIDTKNADKKTANKKGRINYKQVANHQNHQSYDLIFLYILLQIYNILRFFITEHCLDNIANKLNCFNLFPLHHLIIAKNQGKNAIYCL